MERKKTKKETVTQPHPSTQTPPAMIVMGESECIGW